MSFLDKIKQVAGIGALSVELQIPEQLNVASQRLNGHVKLTAASRQTVKTIRIYLRARVISGHGEDETKRDYELGQVELNKRFALEQGEVRSIDFALPFQVRGFTPRQGGSSDFLGAARKFFAAVNNERVQLEVGAVVDIEGAALDPNVRQPIQFM